MSHINLCVVWSQKSRLFEFVLTRNSQVGGGVSQLTEHEMRKCLLNAHVHV